MIDELFDTPAQISDRGERATADRTLCDQAEPAFDLIEPGAIGRRVVQMEARMARQPRPHFRMLVGRVVVDDQIQIELGGNRRVDVSQKAQELLMPVPRLALREHLPLATSSAANRVVVPWR